MKKSLLTCIVLQMISCGLIISPAQAAILGSFDINEPLYGTGAIINQIECTILFGGDPLHTSAGATLAFILSADSVGETFTVSSGTVFDEAVTYLTNGTDDYIEYMIYNYPGELEGVGAGSCESYVFFGDYSGANGIDFTGYAINSINLIVNSLTFDTPGIDYNKDGVWTDVAYNATVVIDGTAVPEPATFFMLVIGLIGMILYRRRGVRRND